MFTDVCRADAAFPAQLQTVGSTGEMFVFLHGPSRFLLPGLLLTFSSIHSHSLSLFLLQPVRSLKACRTVKFLPASLLL